MCERADSSVEDCGYTHVPGVDGLVCVIHNAPLTPHDPDLP